MTRRFKRNLHFFWLLTLIAAALLSITIVQAQEGRTIKIG